MDLNPRLMWCSAALASRRIADVGLVIISSAMLDNSVALTARLRRHHANRNATDLMWQFLIVQRPEPKFDLKIFSANLKAEPYLR